MTYGDNARSRCHCGNQVVRRNKAVSRRYDFQFHALAFFHWLPGGVLQWELSLGGDDLVARLPCQPMCHGRDASACAGGQCDFFGFRPNHFRQGTPNSVWRLEPNGVVYVMGKPLRFERDLHRAQRNTRHCCVCCSVQIGCVCNLEPLLLPVGCNLNRGHEVSFSVSALRSGEFLAARSGTKLAARNSGCECYSSRRATSGSTSVARRAGTKHASNATAASSAGSAANVSGSLGETA